MHRITYSKLAIKLAINVFKVNASERANFEYLIACCNIVLEKEVNVQANTYSNINEIAT